MSETARQINRNYRELARRKREERLKYYKPYPKQSEFHAAGATHRERLLRAGNQQGKSIAGASETAMHLTGEYPDNWNGKVFDKPIRVWVGGIADDLVRDNPQKLLLGLPGMWGTGYIPMRCIDIKKIAMGRGVTGSVDTAQIKHTSGDYSVLMFKSYKEGREKWQSDSIDLIWMDEEPPPEIYSEALARISATNGILFVTFTPLMGGTELVNRFLIENNPDRHDTQMGIEDALHIPAARRQSIIDSYPEHEREARTQGIPMLGSGRVFPISEESIKVDPFKIPMEWPQLGGLDFGWNHPAAAANLAWDKDNDCIYVVRVFRVKENTPIQQAAVLKEWGHWLPWVWPHDGLQHDKGSGEQLAAIYRKAGLNLTQERATFEDGTNGFEAGITEMLTRMQTGRLKVFSNCNEWFEEFRLYHRKEGLVVKLRDDLMSATRTGIMARRYAKTRTEWDAWNRPFSQQAVNTKWVV